LNVILNTCVTVTSAIDFYRSGVLNMDNKISHMKLVMVYPALRIDLVVLWVLTSSCAIYMNSYIPYLFSHTGL